MQQERYWHDNEPDTVNVLDIGVSEFVDIDVVDESPKRSSRVVSRNPLSYGISLHAMRTAV